MDEKLKIELDKIYGSYEIELKTAIDYCNGNNKKGEYKRILDKLHIDLVSKASEYKLLNKNKIQKYIAELNQKIVTDYLTD